MKKYKRVSVQTFYLTIAFVFVFITCNNQGKRVVLQNKDKAETLIVYNDTNKASKPKVVEIETPLEEVEADVDLDAEEEKTEESSLENLSVVEEPIVFEGMTLNELAAKLDRSLTSTLTGTGYTFASRAVELGIDPYLAVGIVLHETGCAWNCSSLVRECNNVGGMKGSPGCGGGSYKAFTTLDEGINSYMNNLYNNYYAQGLTTPEAMNPKYAASTTWSSKVRVYMDKLRAA